VKEKMQLFWTIVGANIASRVIMVLAKLAIVLVVVAIDELKK
jgi:hypothetical protein